MNNRILKKMLNLLMWQLKRFISQKYNGGLLLKAGKGEGRDGSWIQLAGLIPGNL